MEEMKPTPPATRETIIDRLGKLCQEAAREGVVNPEYDTILDPFCRRVNAVAAEAASTLAAMREDNRVLAEEVRGWRKGDLRLKPLGGPSGGGNPTYKVIGAEVFIRNTDASGALTRAKAGI